MTISPQQTQKVLSGNYAFSQLGFSMLITRLKGVYSKDQSQASLQKCTGEINVFLDKFKTIMGPDYAVISKL